MHISMLLFIACAATSQCIDQANTTVCMPSSWRCDKVYQCRDGKDEMSK